MATTAGEALYRVLNVHAATAALIGAGDAMRLYPTEAPMGAQLAHAVYNVIGGDPQNTHAQGNGDARLDGVDIQISAFAVSQLKADQLMHQMLLAIEADAGLAAVCTRPAQALGRDEAAGCYGTSADFRIWNNPDA